MRKIVAGLSAVALALCMVGCGEEKPVKPQDSPNVLPETPKTPSTTPDVKEEVEKKTDGATNP